MSRQVGRRVAGLLPAAAAAAAAVPALLVAAALTTRSPALISVAAIVTVGLACRLFFAATGSLLRRLVFSRLPLADQLPADVWAGVLAVPVATALASGLAGGGVGLWTLTVGPQAPLAGAYRATALCAVIAAAMIAVGVPTLAGYRIALQRRGEQEVPFDPLASPAAVRRDLARRRAALLARRRVLLRGLRDRLLASAAAPAAGPADPGSRRPPAVPAQARAAVTGCAGVVVGAAGLLAWPSLADVLGETGQTAAAVALTACLTALVVAADLYRLVLGELSEAAVLARADAVLRGRDPATTGRAVRRRRASPPPAGRRRAVAGHLRPGRV